MPFGFRQRTQNCANNASMLNKIYLLMLAVAVLAMGVLIYFPYSWLQSLTAPKDVAANYLFYANLSWTFMLISTLVLLILANVVLWKTRRAWAMWATLLYFAIFTIAQKFWLDQAFFNYQQTNNLTDSAISFGALFGVVLIVLAAIIVFFDQYLVKRLLDKTSPPLQPVEALPEEVKTDNDDV